MNSKFAVCQDRAHGELTIVRRVLGKRHTANLNTLPCAKTLGTRRRALLLGPACPSSPCAYPGGTRRSGKFRRVPTSWHTAKSSVTPLGRPHDVNAFFAVYPWIHTANVFAVCPINGTRQTRPLRCLALPLGVRRRPPTAKTSPCAY